MFKIIFKPFIWIFKLIYYIIDKLFVTPVSRLLYKLNDVWKDNGGKIEKLLNRPNALIYVSLLCALVVFFLVDSQVINLTEREAEIISGQKVDIIYNEEAYVIEGVPETVDITLIGNKSTIYLATQLGEHEVTLDLSKYGTGTYKVKLKYKHSVQSVDYKLDPSTVTVKISEKVSEVKTLSYDLMNEDKLDQKLSISAVKLDTNEVIIKSSEEILSRVAVVKALIDASQVSLTESGDYTIENVTLVAYDDLGNKLDNVEMVPGKVSATVTIDSYHATKPVKVITSGTMSNGKAIASITSSVKEVVVYGEKSIVDEIDFVEAEVPIDDLSKDKEVSVNLIRPSGVRYMSETTTKINVKVDEQTQRTISGVTVVAENVASGYVVQASTEADKKIDVILKGVASVINAEDINETTIRAYVDVTGLKTGTHTVEVKLFIDDERITVQAVKTEISVKITEQK